MERIEYLIHRWMHFFPGKKGLYKAKVRCSLQTGSSGGIKQCVFVFLGCCQTPWNDRVERNVRFPPFIIMVTLKPNYSRLNSSLLAMLLLMAAPKCRAWQGAGWAAQTSHWSLGRAGSSSRHPGPLARLLLKDRSTVGHAAVGPTARWCFMCHQGHCPQGLATSPQKFCSQRMAARENKTKRQHSNCGSSWKPPESTRSPCWSPAAAGHSAECLLWLWWSQGLVTLDAAFLLQDLPSPLCFMFLSPCTPKTRQLSLDLKCPRTLPLPRRTTTGNPTLR